MESGGPSGDRSLQEALRAAVERTLAATAGSASETRGRAEELLDDVARRGQDARESVSRRGQEARENTASLTTRVVDAIRELRLASGEEVKALDDQLAEIERRVADLERRMPDPEPKVEEE